MCTYRRSLKWVGVQRFESGGSHFLPFTALLYLNYEKINHDPGIGMHGFRSVS